MPTWFQTVFLFAYEWLRDWQLLVCTGLVIWTLRTCSREIRQSLRRPQAALRHPDTVAFEQTQPESPIAETPATLSQDANSTVYAARLRADVNAVPRDEVIARLETLRNSVRQALAAIPLAGGSIAPENGTLYRKVMSFSLADVQPAEHFDHESLPIFEELQSVLAHSHGHPIEAIDAKVAWEGLVRINALARKLQVAAKSQEPSDPHRARSVR